MKIKAYIESGALEAYVMGLATVQEVDELLLLKARYTEVEEALNDLETNLEVIARNMAISPPPGSWMRIEKEISELKKQSDVKQLKITSAPKNDTYTRHDASGDFLEVHGPSSHMRVHKAWRWVLTAIFILGKIFLGFAIFYYLESRQAREQIIELKQQLKERQSK